MNFWTIAWSSLIATILSVLINETKDCFKNKLRRKKDLTAYKNIFIPDIENNLNKLKTILNQAIPWTEVRNLIGDTLDFSTWNKYKLDLEKTDQKSANEIADFYIKLQNLITDYSTGMNPKEYSKPVISYGENLLKSLLSVKKPMDKLS